MIIKRKGQIVPKYLVESVEKKAQHLIKFGADVRIEGRKITALGGGTCIEVPSTTHVLKKKRQRRVKGFDIYDICFVGFDCGIKIQNNSVGLDNLKF